VHQVTCPFFYCGFLYYFNTNKKTNHNGGMTSTEIQQFCQLDEKSKAFLEQAFNRLGLSARAHSRILKVARTIADLAGSEQIQLTHLAEAIQYRTLDKKLWK
jgi:magnesium chelatase family protein